MEPDRKQSMAERRDKTGVPPWAIRGTNVRYKALGLMVGGFAVVMFLGIVILERI